MQASEKNALKTVVEEKMRKMFFSQPVINRYFESVSQKELISMNTLLADEQLAAAIIDRIVHYGHLVNTGVKDWRLTYALMNDR